MEDRTFVTLFENKPGQFEGDTTIRATLKPDGSLDLVDSALTSVDTRVFGHGAAYKTLKYTPNHPDVKGALQIPFDRDCEPDPGKREVVGWWRWTRRGKRALRLCYTAPAAPSHQLSRASAATA